MKLKITKAAFGYKANDEVEIADAAEVKTLIDGGFAVEVKEDAASMIVEKAANAIAERLDATDEKVSALETKVAKALAASAKSKRPNISVIGDNIDGDPNHGFKNFGEFASALKNGGTDTRLKGLLVTKAGTPSDGGAATADGGALIPVGFMATVLDPVAATESLFPYIDSMPIVGRTMTIPVQKHYDFTNTNTSNGIVAQYVSENSDANFSKSQYELLSFSLKTLVAIVPTSEQLEEDAGVALGSYLSKEGNRQINEVITKNILRNVSGGVSGLLGAGHGAVDPSVLKVQRQSDSGVDFADILKIYESFYGDISKAVWVIHPTVLPQIGNMTSGNFNIYIPAGVGPNGPSNPFGSLMGRPIVVNQYASPLGSAGDIGLYDLSKYQACYRSGGIDTAMSMHLFFASLQNVYRFVWRWDAKSKLSTTVTRADGSSASPFVILDNEFGT